MDHRISKDMISSGMSFTGEKTQADLGRTQYGSAARPNSLMEAYASMYKKQEIQEGEYDDAKRAESSATEMKRRAADRARRERMRTQPGGYGAGDPQDKPKNESVDLFDLIKGHFIGEGLTEEEAIQKMVSMTEEERNAVIEQYTINVADVKGGTQAAKNAAAGMKDKKGNPLYKPGVGVGPDFKLLKGV